MDIHGFVAFARNHFSNTKLEVEDILPTANADWDATFFDGHASTATVGTNTTNIATNATSIVTNAGGITSAGVAISTNASDITAKQDTLSFGTVSETGKVVLSENIKSYVDASGFTFQGDSGTVTADWKYDVNPPTIDVDDWYMIPTDFGTKQRISVKVWFTGSGYRSLLLKYDSGFLRHSTYDVDFSFDEVNTDISSLDAFWGGYSRYSVTMGSGDEYNANQPVGESHDGDIMAIRFNCQTPSTVYNSHFWVNVRVCPIGSRYYHEAT